MATARWSAIVLLALLTAPRSLGRTPALLWVDDAGKPRDTAWQALALLDGAANDGLEPDDYQARGLRSAAHRLAAPPPASKEEVRRFEHTLTAMTTRYLHDLHVGRVSPRALGFRLNPPNDRDFERELRQAVVEQRLREKAAEIRPALVQYRWLRDALARYRALAAKPSDEFRGSASVVIRPGDACEWADWLRRRLIAVGDLPATTPEPLQPTRYDDALVAAVKRFQTRHGLAADGVLGKATVAALRVPLATRVRQIEWALERLRWLPDFGDQRLLVVNIPMFQLWAWDDARAAQLPAFTMKIIVGRARATRTPVFVEQLRELTFRPYWNVPRSILRAEILPILARDPDYLRRENMEIVRGESDDGQVIAATADAIDGLRRGALRLRQRPGPRNSLGLIKFTFPNEENVFMHGTPAQTLFARSRRDFSHGCIRVEDPVRLAAWVLQDRPDWDRSRILTATAGLSSLQVRLARPIPVVLFYMTAAVMPLDGSIRFADDIYGDDARLERALAQRRGED